MRTKIFKTRKEAEDWVFDVANLLEMWTLFFDKKVPVSLQLGLLGTSRQLRIGFQAITGTVGQNCPIHVRRLNRLKASEDLQHAVHQLASMWGYHLVTEEDEAAKPKAAKKKATRYRGKPAGVAAEAEG